MTGALPDSKTQLLDCAELVRGVSYKREEARTLPGDGLLPVLRANNIQGGRLVFRDLVYVPAARVSAVQMIRKGDIVIAMSSGSPEIVGKGALAIDDWKGGFGAFCGVLRAKEHTRPAFLAHFLRSSQYRQQIERVVTGSNINNLSKSTLSLIEIDLLPESDQRIVAAMLSDIDDREESASAHLAAARLAIERFRQAVLAAACSGRLTADWRDQNVVEPQESVVLESNRLGLTTKRRVAIAEFKADGLPNIPQSWFWAPLAALSAGVLGKMLDKEKNKGERLPYLRNINVRWRHCDLADIQEMPFEPDESERFGIRAGDVMICEGGEPGRAAVWREDGSNMRFQKAIHRVRCADALAPDWLVDVLQAHANSGRLSVYFTGTGIAHLTGVSLARVPIPVPPIEEQAVAVERVEQLMRTADSVVDKIGAAARLVDRSSQAVLAKAFRGELTLGSGHGPSQKDELYSQEPTTIT